MISRQTLVFEDHLWSVYGKDECVCVCVGCWISWCLDYFQELKLYISIHNHRYCGLIIRIKSQRREVGNINDRGCDWKALQQHQHHQCVALSASARSTIFTWHVASRGKTAANKEPNSAHVPHTHVPHTHKHTHKSHTHTHTHMCLGELSADRKHMISTWFLVHRTLVSSLCARWPNICPRLRGA